MKNKSITLSRTAATLILGSLIFVGFFIYFRTHHLESWGWVALGCGIFFLLSACTVPLFYVVDDKGIRIRYLTGDREIYDWKNVRGIKAEYDMTIPFVFDSFLIDGEDYTFYMFYKEGRMERSARLARMIKKYSGKEVIGILPEGLKGAAARRYKLSYCKAPDSVSAKAREREARKEVRSILAKADRTEAVCAYSYLTADGETPDRPVVDYTYILTLKKGDEALAPIEIFSVKRKGKRLIPDEIDTNALSAKITKAFN